MSWAGVVGASGDHHELATRAWCHRDKTYCYEHALCTCCMAASDEYEVCSHCDGEGYVKRSEVPV